jgi:endoglucanase
MLQGGRGTLRLARPLWSCAAALALLPLACALAPVSRPSPEATDAIRLNQLGFYPGLPKLAVVADIAGTAGKRFEVTSADGGRVVFRGKLGSPRVWPFSEETVRVADFSALRRPGRYRVRVDGLGSSVPFTIGKEVHHGLARAALKGFFFNRASFALDTAHAGPWARPAGHPDSSVLVHASAAGAGRPAGSTLAAPGGWYDAGDYNKYVITTSYTVYLLLAAYEHYPQTFERLDAGIPESGNDIPDVIDEAVWGLRWLLAMQDPADGGVYHKLTNEKFDGFVMPHAATAPRFVVQKTTAATLDFAAVTAHAGRLLGRWSGLADLAGRCREASRAAWGWAEAHPQVLYVQPPGFETGTYVYDHETMADERVWAAVELYLASGDAAYLAALDLAGVAGGVPSWDYVAPLAWLSLAYEGTVPGVPAERIRERVVSTADRLRLQSERSAYRVAMGAYPERLLSGANEKDFSWGSNGMAASQGIVLLAAFRLTGDRGYLSAAAANLDYLLGRNAVGTCFVTGFGSRSPRRIHHRPSLADGVDDPVPGLLSGGPHDGLQDARDCGDRYTSRLPALAWVDHECSYATNEVAINWNAPLVYLAGAIEDLTRDGAVRGAAVDSRRTSSERKR